MKKTKLEWESLGELLEDAATRFADNPLFVFEGASLSFAEVNARSSQVANLFSSLGLSKGDRVSVMLPNGLDFPVIWLAIAKAGLIMVPTNTEYQKHDLDFILNDSKASCMILHADFVDRLEQVRKGLPDLAHILTAGGEVDGFSSFESSVSSQSSDYVIKDVDAMDLVNIQYTSGTTGFPKGCMLPHRYWLMMGHIARQPLDLGPSDVDFTAQPFYYMDPQWNVTLCLMTGMSLLMVPRFSVSRFWQTIVDNNVSFFYCIGAMPLMLLDQEPTDQERAHRVKAVSCSGIPAHLHETIEKRFGCPWREGYGTTESGTDLLVPYVDTECVGTGYLGKPPPSKVTKIVDDDDKELPDGEVGELLVRGEPLMRGYWNNSEATDVAFRGGWYHTGDLFIRNPKGQHIIVGRKKDMIRRSGENISAAEVEGVLVDYPDVKLAAVVPVADRVRGEEVKAYLQLADGASPESVDAEKILEFAREKLAAFKVPRYVEYVTSFSMTASERIEKHKLIEDRDDQRLGSFDSRAGKWLTQDDLEAQV